MGGLTMDEISQQLNVDLGSRVTALACDEEGNYYAILAVEAPDKNIIWHKDIIIRKIS